MSPLHFTSTREAARLHGVKICVHGRAGTGKTTLVKTLAESFDTLLLSAESGVLSLGNQDIPQITIHNFAEMEEAYQFVAHSSHAMRFGAIALDSISDIAEKCLTAEKGASKDGRKAYGEMHDKVLEMMKKWRDLPGKHVYFSAKQGRFTDEISNVTRYGPDMPGKQLVTDVPYLFDELFSLELGRTPEGVNYRYLLTQTNMQYEAKDRSGILDVMEEPHLGKVINKILLANVA